MIIFILIILILISGILHDSDVFSVKCPILYRIISNALAIFILAAFASLITMFVLTLGFSEDKVIETNEYELIKANVSNNVNSYECYALKNADNKYTFSYNYDGTLESISASIDEDKIHEEGDVIPHVIIYTTKNQISNEILQFIFGMPATSSYSYELYVPSGSIYEAYVLN